MLSLAETKTLIADLLKLYENLTRSTLVYLEFTVDNSPAITIKTAGDIGDYLVNLQKEVDADGQEALLYRLRLFAAMPEKTTMDKNSKIGQKVFLEHLVYGDRYKVLELSPMECGEPACSGHGKLMACSVCHCVNYCSKTCQKSHWKGGHKHHCIYLTETTRHVDKSGKTKRHAIREPISGEDVEQFLKENDLTLDELVEKAPSLYSMFKK